MRRFAFAAMAMLVTCGAVAAADLGRPAPVPTYQSLAGWTGFYLGLNAGGALANGRSDFAILGTPPFASVNNSLSGAIGGAQAGYNWQFGAMVAGFEADIQGASLKGGLSAPPCPAGLCALALTATYEQKVSWFGSARGRLGYAAAGWLLYATGGYAYAHLETNAFASAGGIAAATNLNETRSGWTAGAGIEIALAPQWSTRLEYLGGIKYQVQRLKKLVDAPCFSSAFGLNISSPDAL